VSRFLRLDLRCGFLSDETRLVVSRAFQILSDSEKKAKYDKFGGDPDSRFQPSGGPAGASPFGGFSGGGFPRGPGGPGFDEEISPEELFNRFFNGGLGGGFGPFGMTSFCWDSAQGYELISNPRRSAVRLQHGRWPRVQGSSVWRLSTPKTAS
jgi:DnaJ-class molecular chaperone